MPACSRYVCRFAATSARESCGRSLLRPDGAVNHRRCLAHYHMLVATQEAADTSGNRSLSYIHHLKLKITAEVYFMCFRAG
jgi:hypothetical protein